jgi:hypothetical protein
MKNKFGKIKSKILKKVTDLYTDNNKKELKDILSIINEDKNFKELYLFYEEIENLDMTHPGSAELYVESIIPLLSSKLKSVSETNKKLNKYIKDVIAEDNELYDNLDILAEEDTMFNLDKKVLSKQKLIEHLKKEKIKDEVVVESYTDNEKLLATVLTNNFNVLFNSIMNENDKTKFKELLGMNQDEITNQINEMRTEIIDKVEKLLSESVNEEFNYKLRTVKSDVLNTKPTRYNLYKLEELKNGLN